MLLMGMSHLLDDLLVRGDRTGVDVEFDGSERLEEGFHHTEIDRIGGNILTDWRPRPLAQRIAHVMGAAFVLHRQLVSTLAAIHSLIGIPLAVLLARQAKATHHPSSPHFKKISLTTGNLFTRGSNDKGSIIDKPQEPNASEQKRSVPPDGISYTIRDEHSGTLLRIDSVGVERAKLNRAVIQYLKK